MTSRGLPGFSTALASAGDASEALSALYDEAVDADRGAVVGLFRNDARRDLFVERIVASGNGIRRDDIAVAFDHLPSQVRQRVTAAVGFVEFGDGSADFVKLLGLPAIEGGALVVRGLSLDGELCGMLALIEPKKRFGARVLDKLVPASEMFALAYARLLERDARIEAVRSLEEITRSIHDEYGRTLSDMEQRLHSAQDASLAGRGLDNGRAANLERALNTAQTENRAVVQRLAAVDQQVSVAVSKLERAHMELHQQTETARRHSERIHTLRQRMETALESPDVRAAIEDVLRSLRNYE